MDNEKLSELDAELKGFFIESKLEEMKNLLQEQSDVTVSDLFEYTWNIIQKYYDAENYELLFRYLSFVAYSCFLVEYTYQQGLIDNKRYHDIMMIYNEIYDKKKQQ
ncbi:MAG: hypothetical protein WBI07_14395 [Mobilitalea sp.]